MLRYDRLLQQCFVQIRLNEPLVAILLHQLIDMLLSLDERIARRLVQSLGYFIASAFVDIDLTITLSRQMLPLFSVQIRNKLK